MQKEMEKRLGRKLSEIEKNLDIKTEEFSFQGLGFAILKDTI